MKILMLGWELPPHNSGGLGIACLNLARALAKQGVEIDFVVPYLAEHENIDFMNIVSAAPIDPFFRFGGGAYNSQFVEQKMIEGEKLAETKGNSQKISIRDIQQMYCDFIEKYLQDARPDFIHAHDWLTFEAGVLAKKNFNIPFVAHVHATEFDRSGMNGGNPLIHEIEREALMLADEIIAVSKNTKRIIHEKYDIPLNKINVTYNSLDDDFLKTTYVPDFKELSYIREMKNLGYTVVSTVGRFTIQKGLSHFMRAAARALEKNPKLLFVLAGDGEERNELIAMAAELGIAKNVVFTGFIRGRRLREIYSISDIFVMSSISEPFGLTALEASHHDNILILTKQSGVAEIIHSAFRYDFWDDEKLANEILAVVDSKALRETLREGVKAEYLKISWDDIAKKCVKIYNKIRKT